MQRRLFITLIMNKLKSTSRISLFFFYLDFALNVLHLAQKMCIKNYYIIIQKPFNVIFFVDFLRKLFYK